MCMRTVIEIDDELIERAARELGTTTKKDTVNAALKFVTERPERIRRVREGVGTEEAADNPYERFGVGADIGNPEIMRQARR